MLNVCFRGGEQREHTVLYCVYLLLCVLCRRATPDGDVWPLRGGADGSDCGGAGGSVVPPGAAPAGDARGEGGGDATHEPSPVRPRTAHRTQRSLRTHRAQGKQGRHVNLRVHRTHGIQGVHGPERS